MNTVRAYKLQQLGIDIDPVSKGIIEYIEEELNNTSLVYLKLYPKDSFYYNKDNCLFAITNKNFLYINVELFKNCTIQFIFSKDDFCDLCTFLIYKKYGLKLQCHNK